MKKSKIIAIVILGIVILGLCSNGIVFRDKFFKGEFDDPYRNSPFVPLDQVKTINISGDTSLTWRGAIEITQNDTLARLLSPELKDFSCSVDNRTLNIERNKYIRFTRIVLPELEKLEVKCIGKVTVDGFEGVTLDILSANKANVRLKNCNIKNLRIYGSHEGSVSIDSTNNIGYLELNVFSKASFYSLNVSYDSVYYDIGDDCSILLSGESLDILK